MILKCRRSGVLAAVLGLVFAPWAPAHDPGLSSATVQVKATSIEAELAFAVADAENLAPLDTNEDGQVSQAEFAQNSPRLAGLFQDKFQVSLDDSPLPPSEPTLRLDDKNNVEVRIKFDRPSGSMLVVKCAFLEALPSGHREYFVLQDGAGNSIIERLLSRRENTVTFELALMSEATRDGPPHSFAGFLWLGVEHILIGFDHLLFLFALLLASGNFISSLKIITCFTIAHSVTLALATFEIVQVSTDVVEPMIAASIVYVGVENLVSRGAPKGRWMLTFAFGLVHGFGFASVLRELGIASGSSGVAVPLFAFNAGVELGQVAIAALILPLIWRLRREPIFVRRWIPACSMLVALVGAFWFVQRVTGF